MKIDKNRVEALSDGLIAIIITIMVLEIPLPEEFTLNEILILLHAIFVFFVSFIVVGAQWNKHRFLFENIKEVTDKIIWRNFIFLFFLSLMPIFTKWIIDNPGEVVPAIGYEIVFILVIISYQIIWDDVIKENVEFESYKNEMQSEEKLFFPKFLRTIFAVIILTAVSIFYPKISLIFLLFIPVAISLYNLISEKSISHRKHEELIVKLYGDKQETENKEE